MTDNQQGIVRTHVSGTVGHVVLNRPDAMNAITIALGRELERAFEALAGSVTTIVIRGAGGHFSVGGDFHELQALRAEGPAALQPLFENFGRACAKIAELPVPVVALVEGYAMAGGFELMQSCDIALVRADAKIADNHANFAQIPGGGSSQRLPRLVGRQRALGHILSGDRLSGDEAAAWGLAYRSFAPEEFDIEAQKFVQRLADKDRVALGNIKRLVYEGLRVPLEQGLQFELSAVVEHVCGESAREGIDGFTKTGEASHE